MLQPAPAANELHGAGFLFFRDHHLSAYPALERDPFNPDPFFQRRQFGLSLGGPIRKDRAFFFGTFERTEQRGVISTDLLSPDFAPLSGIYPSPTYVNQFGVPDGLQTYPKATDVRALLARRQLLLCRGWVSLPRGRGRRNGLTRAFWG